MSTKSKTKQQKFNSLALKISVIGIFVILLGVAHGFYVVAEREQQTKFMTGSDFCNGNYTSTTIKANSLGTTLYMNYKLLIDMGITTITIQDPSGNIIFERTDDASIIRQHAIKIDTKEELGDWTVSLTCSRAEIVYELALELRDI